jgi:hypothetical protein
VKKTKLSFSFTYIFEQNWQKNLLESGQQREADVHGTKIESKKPLVGKGLQFIYVSDRINIYSTYLY